MSRIKVDRITNRAGTGEPLFPNGVKVVGLTSLSNVVAGIATFSNVSVGGTLTYEDVTNIDSVGLITARRGIIATGVVTATSFKGDGSQLTGIDTDKISEGNTEVEVIDTGSDGHVKMTTEGSERVRVGPAGQIGLSGANYGDSGQLLTSGGSGAAPTWTTVSAAPTTELIANGAITANAGVVVNASGQVEGLSGEVAAIGSKENFETQSADKISTCKIADNKYVIAWQSTSNSSVGKVRAASVSGTTVTYGTTLQFEGNTTTNVQICRINDTKFGLVFRDSTTNRLKCLIGSVSGTTVTKGTDVDMAYGGGTIDEGNLSIGYQQDVNCLLIFSSSPSNTNKPYVHTCRPDVSALTVNKASNGWVQLENQNNAHDFNVVENTTDNELLLTWISSPQQNGGRSITAKCSGASGDHTVTYGQNEYISNQNQWEGKVCYNADDNKYLYVFRNQDQSNQLSQCCGTPSNSGTNRTISWTSYSNFYTGGGSYPDLAYDTTAKKYLLTYANDTGKGSWILYKQNGTSVQADGSHESFETASGITNNYMARCINISSGKFAIVYPRATSNGTSLIRQLVTTNLTAGNFIGFADANYTNGQTVTIKIVGNTVTGQSGLTPGSKYYVSGDGSLTTTEGTPSVVAGTALSATKLLIKPQ